MRGYGVEMDGSDGASCGDRNKKTGEGSKDMAFRVNQYGKKGFIVLCVLTAALSGCSGQKQQPVVRSADTRAAIYDTVDAGTSDMLKNTIGFSPVTKSGDLELLVNGQTTEIAVKNKVSGKIWYSSPQPVEGETTLNNADFYKSQVILKYTDGQQKTFERNSFTDAVSNNQFSFCGIEGGIRVNYTIGIKPVTYIVPNVLTVERFNSILAKLDDLNRQLIKTYYLRMSLKEMSDSDKALQQNKYPILKTSDIYILSTNGVIGKDGMSSMLLETLEPVFTKTGYTEADLLADQKASGEQVAAVTDTSVTLSVEYTLDENGFEARIPQDSISYDRSVMNLTHLSLLPYFGATNQAGNGYLFIPDGSGAIIDFTHAVNNFATYEKEIYGPDKTLSEETMEQGDQTRIYLPVYGMKEDQDAFLAIIEEGDAAATLRADVKNTINAYPFVYPEFTIKKSEIEKNSILNVAGNQIFQNEELKSDLKIRYQFLSGDQADYTGMANSYRQYLLQNKYLNKASNLSYGMNIDLTGAVTYTSSFLGIPVQKELPLTTYSQAEKIMGKLKTAGIGSLSVSYRGWQNKGMQNTISDKIRYLDVLGGKKEFSALLASVASWDIRLFPGAEFQYVSNLRGFHMNEDAAKDLSDLPSWRYEYDLSLLQQTDKNKAVIVSPTRYGDLMKQYLASSKKEGLVCIGLSGIGTDLNSDFSKTDSMDRQQAKKQIQNDLQELAKGNFQYLVNGGNLYTLSHAALTEGIPTVSGNNYLFSGSVPFIQIVLHGIVPYAGEPLNLSDDYETAVLQIMETGTIPSFSWIYAENSALKDTNCNYYSMNYSSWLEKAGAVYREFYKLADCQGAGIIGHKKENGLAVTTYDNGITVYVNYTNRVMKTGNHEIAAKSCQIWKGDEKIG